MIEPIVVYRLDSKSGQCSKVEVENMLSVNQIQQNLPEGVYTTFRTYDQLKAVRPADHFTRLNESARLSGVALMLHQSQVREALHQLLLTRSGESRVRISVDLTAVVGQVYLMIEALSTPSPDEYLCGVSVGFEQYHRTNPKSKSTAFIKEAERLRQRMMPGMNEIIMVSETGELLEGLSSNVFCVYDGTVYTAEEGVLSGFTRTTVLHLLDQMSVPVVFHGINCQKLDQVDELFITSASRGVLPVSRAGDFRIGAGAPGEITQELIRLYEKEVRENLEII